MFMSTITLEYSGHVFPDLAGARVLITGVTSETGVDVARAFAEHKTRLIIQSPEVSHEMTEVGALLAVEAAEIEFFNDPLISAEQSVQLTQRAAKVYGGLDAVINFASIKRQDMTGVASLPEVETFVSSKLFMVSFTRSPSR